MKILVVDDEPNVREALRSNHRLEGCDARCEPDTAEARRLLQAAEFDVAIVDLRLPGPDGLSASRS